MLKKVPSYDVIGCDGHAAGFLFGLVCLVSRCVRAELIFASGGLYTAVTFTTVHSCGKQKGS